MSESLQTPWEKFKRFYTNYPTLGLGLDLSRVNFSDVFFEDMQPRIQKSFDDMAALESGAIANVDERRMVGHYWLRDPALSPTQKIRQEIESTLEQIKRFAADIHAGRICGSKGAFRNFLVIGIGGSVLGSQFVAHALGNPGRDKLRPFYFDNTDPDGMRRVLDSIGPMLSQTICLIISKSGETKETRNGMLVAKQAYEEAGLAFDAHAVAITQSGSILHDLAVKKKWIQCFPMWDWVGGRTSVTSAVGLLPSALQGFDIDELIAGAKACDIATRCAVVSANPAIQLALAWFSIGGGSGQKNMVILPYKDRLELFSRYLQQLVMESLGKRIDSRGNAIQQGISVFGNKGATDQHSYIQQLVEGKDDFFVVFIEALFDEHRVSTYVEPKITCGDYLSGFLLGTREALFKAERQTVTISIMNCEPFSIGCLIALFERAVGLYASLIEINAYHQPGVESGKKAAALILELQSKVINFLEKHGGSGLTAPEIAIEVGAGNNIEHVFKICEHLAANPGRGVFRQAASDHFSAKYKSTN